MRYSSQVKPISYLKANAAEVLADLAVNDPAAFGSIVAKVKAQLA